MTDVPALFVSTSDSIHADRDLGRRLASHLSRLSQPQPSVIQALLADLLAEDQAFLAPVRDLTGRAAFLALLARSGSGGGRLERDALLQSLAPIYSHAVLVRLSAFLDGLLNLPEQEASQRQTEAHGTQGPPRRPSSTPVAESSLRQPPTTLPMSATIPPAPLASTDGAVSISRDRRLKRRLLLVVVCGLTVGFTAGAVLLLRSGVFCELSAGLPFCPARATTGLGTSEGRSPEQAISASLQAARDLATATDLNSFEHALEQLEANLLPLASASLSPSLLSQRQSLEAIERTARERLQQEQSDRHSVEMAREARDLALRQTDTKAMAAVDAAISQLQSISSGSFSEADARSVLRDLEAARLRLQPSAPTQTTPAPTDPLLTPPPLPNPSPNTQGADSGAAKGRDATSGQRPDPLF
ncbi:MAG: hypothetical protein ACKOCM_03710 [Cyanobacteriota bacterium]